MTSLSLIEYSRSNYFLYMNYFTRKIPRLWNNVLQPICEMKSLPSLVRCIDVYLSRNMLIPVCIFHFTSEIIRTSNAESFLLLILLSKPPYVLSPYFNIIPDNLNKSE